MSRSKRSAVVAAILFLSQAALGEIATAEMAECDGIWTNKPCGVDASAVPIDSDTAKKAAAKEKAFQLSKKRSLFHELTMKSIRAKREYQISYELDEVEEFCFAQESDFADCKARIKTAQSELNSEIAQIALVRENEKANRLKEEANKLQEERNRIEASNPTVVVNERRRYYIDPYRLKGDYRPGRRGGLRSGRHYHRRTAGGAAINISGSGNLGGGTRLNIGGSFGGSSTTTSSSTAVNVRRR